MGKHRTGRALPARGKPVIGDLSGRHRRTSWSLPVFASFVTFAFLAVSLASPYPVQPVDAASVPRGTTDPTQSIEVADHFAPNVVRDAFATSKVRTTPVAPAAGIPDPGTAQAIALEMVTARGWGAEEFDCLVALWKRESNWNVYAHNTSSGAYGIPQALPGTKMATAGADWATNPATQITWGLGYIQARYQTPCGAWASSESRGWY